MYYLCVLAAWAPLDLFIDEETQEWGALCSGEPVEKPGLGTEPLRRLPAPHLSSKQLLQLGIQSFARDQGVLLFTLLQASILAKCFLVIYWRVNEANRENDRALFFLIYFNFWAFVSGGSSRSPSSVTVH